MKIKLTIAIVLAIVTSGFGQLRSGKVANIELESKAQSAYLDRAGDLYVITTSNHLHKISGNRVEYSTALTTSPTIFDPRDGSHLFLYSREAQEYTIMLPDLSARPAVSIDPAYAVAPFLVCPSGEQHLLILDSADWSLKKINRTTRAVMYETIILNEVVDPSSLTYLREYQNFVFLLNRKKGISIFNMMGKRLKEIEESDISYISFLGEEIYFLKEAKLNFFNLFTAETRTLDVPPSADFVFVTDEAAFVLEGNIVQVFK